ncbi:ATP-binding protein, partial [Candidatus Gottesmanbacteria bacterium]|nr:ATP-binding protein [Candidatus Gottesmanbacteria bacterium]
RDSIEKDQKIVDFTSAKYQYLPKQIFSLPQKAGAVNIITGPRQTGKSTAIKLLIRQLLSKKTNPYSLFFYNCDILSNKQEVIDICRAFLDIKPSGLSFIFLDEISSVENWPYAIKWLADTNLLKDSILYLTGSSTINLKKSAEMMPGRRGGGKDTILLPLSFSDVLTLKRVAIEKIAFTDKNVIGKSKHAILQWPSLNRYYNEFLTWGGILRLINSPDKESINNELFLESFRSTILKSGKKEDNLKAVLDKIIRSLGSQTSYVNIAEEAELGSKNTAADYLEFLRDTFFLSEAKFFDIPSQRLILKKNKKFYTTDPYFLWLFYGYLSSSPVFLPFIGLYQKEKGPLVENFIASELYKQNLEFHFYQGKRELDFYIPRLSCGIEVKYKQKITSDDLKPLIDVKRKILVSQNTLAIKDGILIIPAYLFSLLKFD